METFRFHSGHVPDWKRRDSLEELYAGTFGMGLRSIDNTSRVRLQGILLPGLGVVEIHAPPHEATRTPEHVANGNGDWALILPTAGQGAIVRKGREPEICKPGDAYLVSGDELYTTINKQDFSFQVVCLFGDAIESKLADPGSVLMRKVPPGNEGLSRLLVNFARMNLHEAEGLPGDAASLSSTYIHDLVALLLNANEEEEQQACMRGLAAVRLQAIKTFISCNSHQVDLSLQRVASFHNISTHYVRKLFYDTGTSFSDYLTEVRLAVVHQQLLDPLHCHLRIGELAYSAGFGDLSWFNRAFRRLYGQTPSEVRAGARHR